MKFRRKKVRPFGRQRLRPEPSANPNKTYDSNERRFETEPNTGRNLPRAIIKPFKHRAQTWLQRSGLLILSLAILASVVNILTLSSQAKVLPLNSGDNYFLRDLTVYEHEASRLLAASVWNRNKLTSNTAEVSQQMLRKFPELSSVNITVPLLSHRPLVYVKSSAPAVVLTAGNGVFVVADSGKALLKGDSIEALNLPKLPVINDKSGLRIELNRQALPAATIEFIEEITAQLAAKQFTVTTMTLPPAANQLDVQLANQPFSIKFNLQSPTPREQAGTFLATIAELQKQGVTPAQYVDVRVPGRAYYQ